MRQIKFRAWVEDHFVYSDEKPGNPPKEGDSMFGFEDGQLKAWVSVTTTPSDPYEPPYPDAEELEVIEQFTGLLDKNGVEIYEGDVVINDDVTRDTYTPELLKGCVVDMDIGLDWPKTLHKSKRLVTGSVHSDPGLIERTK